MDGNENESRIRMGWISYRDAKFFVKTKEDSPNMALVCAMVTVISHLSVTVLCQGATRRNLPCERAMIAIVYVVVLCSGNSSLQRGFRSSAIYSVPRLEKAILGLHEYHISILVFLRADNHAT